MSHILMLGSSDPAAVPSQSSRCLLNPIGSSGASVCGRPPCVAAALELWVCSLAASSLSMEDTLQFLICQKSPLFSLQGQKGDFYVQSVQLSRKHLHL